MAKGQKSCVWFVFSFLFFFLRCVYTRGFPLYNPIQEEAQINTSIPDPKWMPMRKKEKNNISVLFTWVVEFKGNSLRKRRKRCWRIGEAMLIPPVGIKGNLSLHVFYVDFFRGLDHGPALSLFPPRYNLRAYPWLRLIPRHLPQFGVHDLSRGCQLSGDP